jgi:hypothetical protein
MRTLLLLSTTLALAAAGCSKADPDKAPAATTATPPAATPPAATPPAIAPGAPAPRESSPVIGKPAPDFTLDALDGSKVTLSSFRGKTVVLEWFNPGCPFVQKSHSKGSLIDTAKRHTDGGVVWLAINSGGEGKQGFEPAMNLEAAKGWSLTHPILRDPTGTTGKAYGATNTPNMYVIDPAGVVVYAGAIDNAADAERGAPIGGTLVNYVDAALADLAAGRPVATPVTRPYGCSVKYASS